MFRDTSDTRGAMPVISLIGTRLWRLGSGGTLTHTAVGAVRVAARTVNNKQRSDYLSRGQSVDHRTTCGPRPRDRVVRTGTPTYGTLTVDRPRADPPEAGG